MTCPPVSAPASPRVAVCVTHNRVTLKIIDSELESQGQPSLASKRCHGLAKSEGSLETGIRDRVETEG